MPESARHRAMNLLARREHSRTELARKLARKGFEQADIEQALDELKQEGLQSDARYAQSLLSARASRGQGPVRIRADLRAAAVDDDIIQSAFDATGLNWVEEARCVLEKKFGATPPSDYPEKAKRMRFLQQRGFDPDTIFAAIEPAA